ncbi:MAG: filamentous hemagglutinin, partial [Verrucomicrobia bacterium]|nr:filamentous hemagglutinin [Verrucomicrobiota bacterium]
NDGNAGANKPMTIVSLALNGPDAAKYTLTAPTGLLGEITPKLLGVSGVAASHKVYDGTATATLTGVAAIVAGGVVGSDSVTLDGSLAAGNFADAAVANGKAVTVTGYFLTGTDAANYGVRQPTNLTANITPKSLTLTGLAATNKVYDGSTHVALTGGTLSGVIGSDDVQLSGTAAGSVANANVGTNKAVSFSGLSLSGGEAANYTLSSAAGISIAITPKPLTVVSGLTATNKVYNGTRQATISGTPVLGGVVGSDVVDVDPASVPTALFADANAGTNKVVAVTGYTLTGSEAGNYTLTLPVNLSADIQPKPLTLSGVTATSKVYNKSDVATLGGSASLSGVVGSDIVNLDTSSALARFADANAGTNKAVA